MLRYDQHPPTHLYLRTPYGPFETVFGLSSRCWNFPFDFKNSTASSQGLQDAKTHGIQGGRAENVSRELV